MYGWKNISIHDLKKKSWCWVKNVTIGSKKVIIMSIMEDIFSGIVLFVIRILF